MLDEWYEEERQCAIDEAVAMRAQLENEGVIDKHEKLQPASLMWMKNLLCGTGNIVFI